MNSPEIVNAYYEYSKSGWSDMAGLSWSQQVLLGNAMAVLDTYCHDHGYEGVYMHRYIDIVGSDVEGCTIITVQDHGSDSELVEVKYRIDVEGVILITERRSPN